MKFLFLIITMSFTMLFSCKSKQNTRSVKEGFIQVTGGKIWFRVVGAEKKGIPLLALHGGPGAPHDYLEPMEALACERPVIFYDQLGCGNSEQPSDTTLWNVERFVEELEQVHKALNLRDVHIMGQSWGTMLAVEYMLRKKPIGVQSLILSGPYLSTERWISDQKKWISQLPGNIRDTIYYYEENGNFASPTYQEAMMYFYRKHLCRVDPWPESLNRAMEKLGVEVYQYLWGPSEFTMTGTLSEADLTEHLYEIKVPVLFTCGEFDEAMPSTAAYYQSKLPGSELYIFKDASHSHQLEKPEEYNRIVTDFLKKVEKK